MRFKRWMGVVSLGAVFLMGGLLSCVKEYKQLMDLEIGGETSATFSLPAFHEDITAADIAGTVRDKFMNEEGSSMRNTVLLYREDPNEEFLWKMKNMGVDKRHIVLMFSNLHKSVKVEESHVTAFNTSGKFADIKVAENSLITKETGSGGPQRHGFSFKIFSKLDGFDYFIAPRADFFLNLDDAVKQGIIRDCKVAFTFASIFPTVKSGSGIASRDFSFASSKVETYNDPTHPDDLYRQRIRLDETFRLAINRDYIPSLPNQLIFSEDEMEYNVETPYLEISKKSATSELKEGTFDIGFGVRLPLYGVFKSHMRSKELEINGNVLPDLSKIQDDYKASAKHVDIHLIFKNSLPCDLHFSKKASFVKKLGGAVDSEVKTFDLLNVAISGNDRFKEDANGNRAWNAQEVAGDEVVVSAPELEKVVNPVSLEDEWIVKQGGNTLTHLIISISRQDYDRIREQAKFLQLNYYATSAGLQEVGGKPTNDSPRVLIRDTDLLGIHIAVDLSVNYDLATVKKNVK